MGNNESQPQAGGSATIPPPPVPQLSSAQKSPPRLEPESRLRNVQGIYVEEPDEAKVWCCCCSLNPKMAAVLVILADFLGCLSLTWPSLLMLVIAVFALISILHDTFHIFRSIYLVLKVIFAIYIIVMGILFFVAAGKISGDQKVDKDEKTKLISVGVVLVLLGLVEFYLCYVFNIARAKLEEYRYFQWLP